VTIYYLPVDVLLLLLATRDRTRRRSVDVGLERPEQEEPMGCSSSSYPECCHCPWCAGTTVTDDNNPRYKEKYDPSLDRDGAPLNSLIPCPILACMHNAGQFPTLAEPVRAAQEEKFTGWGSSPAHEALYESRITTAEMTRVLIDVVNCPANVADLILATVEKDPRIFQLQNAMHKHGEATRIRYDFRNLIPGYSEKRFDTFWKKLDKDDDNHMDR
jgi:hypothetical protein